MNLRIRSITDVNELEALLFFRDGFVVHRYDNISEASKRRFARVIAEAWFQRKIKIYKSSMINDHRYDVVC